MATYKYYLRDIKADKETPIILYISYGNIFLKYSTGQKVHPDNWEVSNQKFRKSDLGFYQKNIFLSNFKNDVESVFTTFQNGNSKSLPSPEILKELLNKKFDRVVKVIDRPKELDLFGFIQDFINDSKFRKNKNNKPISTKTIQQYQLAFDKLKKYEKYKKLKKLNFESINADFYDSYNKYLIAEYKHSQNTIANNFKMLKVFFNEAHEKGYFPNFISRKLEVKKVETFSIYLNEKEIEQVYNLDLSRDKKLEKVRDLFIVGCWTGLRFSDLSRLNSNHIKDEFIKIVTQKTDKPVAIPLHPIVKQIILKYKGELPKAISNQKMNDYLKVIGEMAEINNTEYQNKVKANLAITSQRKKFELITTHTARRSFASNMYLMGFQVETIRAITGHTTDQAFKAYIKLSKDDHAKMMRIGWEQRGLFKQAQ